MIAQSILYFYEVLFKIFVNKTFYDISNMVMYFSYIAASYLRGRTYTTVNKDVDSKTREYITVVASLNFLPLDFWF